MALRSKEDAATFSRFQLDAYFRASRTNKMIQMAKVRRKFVNVVQPNDSEDVVDNDKAE